MTAEDLMRDEARYLANAPRDDLELLASGVQAMVAERKAFRWVARYERAFWEMAYGDGDV